MKSNVKLYVLLILIQCNEIIQWTLEVKCTSMSGVFESADYWNIIDKPVMTNGHIGFVPYSNSIYMNGLYNGIGGNSHRARLPNFANIQFDPCSQSFNNHHKNSNKCSYALNIINGVFQTQTNLSDGMFTVEQIQYAHRYYDAAIVNQIRLKRNCNQNANGKQMELNRF